MRIGSTSFLPANAVIELTYGCNHHCIFCSCPWFRDGGSFQVLEELETHHWKDILDELGRCGVSAMAFTGGEALLREDCLELLEHASGLQVDRTDTVDGQLVTRKVHPDLYLLSNGYTLTDEVLEELARLNVNLSLSLPGLSTYEEHTGHDNVDKVLSNFTRASELGVRTTMNSTVTALNLCELEKTLSAGFLAGADQLLLNRFLPGGRGLENADVLSLDREQVVEMLEKADRVLTKAGRPGNLGTETPPCVTEGLDLKTLKVGSRCSAAMKFFVIGPSGFIRVCNHSEVRLDHVMEWRHLKENPYWRRFRMREYMPAQCLQCGYMLDCDGGCREAAHIVGGSLDSADPLLAANTGKS